MKTTYFITLLLFAFSLFAQDKYLPENLIQLDSKFNHHVILVEKSTHQLHIYKNNDGVPQLIKTYKVATGKKIGNKYLQGDERTPEGIYSFKNFHSANFLTEKYGDAGKIYGAGAFTTNYPNFFDRIKGKTGGGIWLHSTDDDNRVDKGLDSRGCVVAKDFDIKDISQYIDLRSSSIIITQDVKYLKSTAWQQNKKLIFETVNNWSQAWSNKDFKTYIAQYSKDKLYVPGRGSFKNFKIYKKAVFARKGKPQINFTDISILRHGDNAIVTLKQDYQSNTIKDIGKKTLYLQKDVNYRWKIVSEVWNKIDEEKFDIAFQPSSSNYFNN